MDKHYFLLCKKAVAAISLTMGLTGVAEAANSGVFLDKSNAPAFQGQYFETYFEIDFSKASAMFPSRNYLTWVNPTSNPPQTVDYFTQYLNSDNTPYGTCFEINSEMPGSTGSDPIIHTRNAAGAWVALADDNAGYSQFRARIFVTPRAQNEYRISHYFTSGTNESFYLRIKKINADPGLTINSQSCRLSGIPFHQADQNGGNPL